MSEATRPSAAVAIAFAIGLGLAIAGLGHISGGHFNPAVSLGVVAARKFPVKELSTYWVAQLVGGFAAVLVVAVVYSNVAVDKLDTAPGAGISEELRRHWIYLVGPLVGGWSAERSGCSSNRAARTRQGRFDSTGGVSEGEGEI